MKNININKKFLIFFSLVLSLLFINSNNVKAYYEESDTIYSSTLKFDVNDYYNENIITIKNYNLPSTCGITVTQIEDGFILNGRTTCVYQQNINIPYIPVGTYSYNDFRSLNSVNTNVLTGFTNPNGWQYAISGGYDNNGKSTVETTQNMVAFRVYIGTDQVLNNVTYKPMLVKGNNIPDIYSKRFQFGYIVSNNQSNAFTLEFIDNYNNNNTYTLINNSSVYLPFQYLNKEVTFSYNVNQNVSSNITSDVTITFTPIFNGTLKSNNSNVLKSTFTYVYNYIYYKNFKLSSYQNIYLDDLLEINYPTTNKDGKSLTLTSVLSPNNVISNFTSDIKQTSIIDKDTYFNGTNSLYSFNIITYMYTNNNGLLYSINFESINLGVVNSSVSNSFPTNTDNDLEIYNTCSGNIFQDFNCNVTNAVTWTIFNIPIIGPLIGFISNLIQLIGQLVTALEWYESLGILFSIFILIMFIKILGILWKGKDE